MKHLLLTLSLLLATLGVHAQDEVTQLTLLPDFAPATIQLSTGKKLEIPLANIFLKNAALLYKSGDKTMQANMTTVVAADFGKRHFVKVGNQLAEQLYDDNHGYGLYCVSTIDMAAYETMVQNANVITSLSLGDNVSMTTTELMSDDERQLPLVRNYLLRIDGSMVEAQERAVKRALNKEQRKRLNSQLSRRGFSWTSQQSLTDLLQALRAIVGSN